MIQWFKGLFRKKAKPAPVEVPIIEPVGKVTTPPAPSKAWTSARVETIEKEILRHKYQRRVVPQPTRQYAPRPIPAPVVTRYHDEVQHRRDSDYSRNDDSTNLILAAMVMNSLSSHAEPSPAPAPEPSYCAAPSPAYESPAPSPSYDYSSSSSCDSSSYSSSDSSSSSSTDW